MISRRSFLTHLLAAAALVPLLRVGDANARQKPGGAVKPSKNRPRTTAVRRRQVALRQPRKPVPRRPIVPRDRLLEGYPYNGWMDPHWYRSSGDPFYDPFLWND
jgi:hypothetical protein